MTDNLIEFTHQKKYVNDVKRLVIERTLFQVYTMLEQVEQYEGVDNLLDLVDDVYFDNTGDRI